MALAPAGYALLESSNGDAAACGLLLHKRAGFVGRMDVGRMD